MESVINELLEKRLVIDDDFVVSNFPGFVNHKIGIDKEENICVFIFSEDSSGTRTFNSCDFDRVKILFNKSFKLRCIEDNSLKEETYSVLIFKSEEIEMIHYFLEISQVILERLEENPTLNSVIESLNYLVEIFKKGKKVSKEVVQGLWSELLIIYLSEKPNYLAESWHLTKSDFYDFNDSSTKLEIKSTKKSKRVHSFSLKQLNPNDTSDLIICSVLVIESGLGTSVRDLLNNLKYRLSNDNYLKLYRIVHETLADSIEFINSISYDLNYSIDELALYSGRSVPSIDSDNIPEGVNNVRFDSDLTKCEKLISSEGNKMLNALGLI